MAEKAKLCASSGFGNLQKIGTEQHRQILQSSLTVATYAKNDDRLVRKFFYTLFRFSFCRQFTTLHDESLRSLSDLVLMSIM